MCRFTNFSRVCIFTPTRPLSIDRPSSRYTPRKHIFRGDSLEPSLCRISWATRRRTSLSVWRYGFLASCAVLSYLKTSCSQARVLPTSLCRVSNRISPRKIYFRSLLPKKVLVYVFKNCASADHSWIISLVNFHVKNIHLECSGITSAGSARYLPVPSPDRDDGPQKHRFLRKFLSSSTPLRLAGRTLRVWTVVPKVYWMERLILYVSALVWQRNGAFEYVSPSDALSVKFSP